MFYYLTFIKIYAILTSKERTMKKIIPICMALAINGIVSVALQQFVSEWLAQMWTVLVLATSALALVVYHGNDLLKGAKSIFRGYFASDSVPRKVELGAPCTECGVITVRNGACYKCFNCGNTQGCS